jgi:peptide/nickel transport system substrate-binding protein
VAIVNTAVMAQEKDSDLAQGWLSANTAGSGAFQLFAWEKGQSITLVPNPNYAGDAPALKSVEVRIIPDASARRLALEAGDIDIAESLPVDQTEAIDIAEGVKVETCPSLLVTYLYLNNAKPPFDNVEARKAMITAVDCAGIIDGIMLAQAETMNATIPAPEWNIEAAKAAFETLGMGDNRPDRAGQPCRGRGDGEPRILRQRQLPRPD